ncbi:ABC transporter permease [Emticicia sp. BO119]|uniref:ABC transporter permease n=1 Tax=Emticicia sp. BO119 TaxID=2757768 RepID=UPI0015F0B15A|nr:ABC transporter permease [Emticicia sp. BO119]MBA4853182.1 ABC transporter permease [Emticicia sp. BO119]
MEKQQKSLTHHKPPQWADRLLEWFVAPHLFEYIQGDLHEHYYKRIDQVGLSHARREYIWSVLSCLTPFFAKRKKNKYDSRYSKNYSNPPFTTMLSNYLTIAFRNLWRHKAFTAVNVLGLAVGLASCLLIVLFVLHELSYDRYHAHADRMYRMTLHGRMDEKEINLAYSAEPAGPTLLREFPGIESMTRIRDDGGFLVKNGHDVFKEENIAFVEPNFFSFFSISMLKGSLIKALVEPKTVVLTETTARKYFGITNPIGKTLTLGNLGIFQVTGVCEDIPSNTHFHFDILGSFKSVNQGTKWLASGAYTYFVLRQGYSVKQLEEQSQNIVNKYVSSEINEFFGLSFSEFLQNGNRFSFPFQRVTEIHLHSNLDDEIETNSDIKYVYIFSIIALFILLLACVNFMNLSTAGSAGRSKEVGIRKVLGSVQKQLIGQFLTESVLLTFFALLLAFGLVIILLPGFNNITGKLFTLSSIFNWHIIPGTIIGCLIIGLLAGSYPAFVLSSFKPITVLKGRIQAGFRSSWLRNTLVTGQFAISIGIMIATIVAYQQLKFIQNKKVGFDKEQVLVLHDTQILDKQLNTFKAELAKLTPVIRVSMAGFLPAGISRKSVDGVQVKNGSRIVTHRTKSYYIDEDYLPTLGVRLAQGRNFSKTIITDNSAILINETAAKTYGFKNPIGQQVSLTGDGSDGSKRTYTIVGVVKDFHFESMHQHIAPLMLFYGGDNTQMALRISTNDIPALLHKIEKLWKIQTDNPFVYSFLNERFNKMYESEQRIGQIFGVFAGLAILISCLGLFGLAAFAAHQRTKEIGVRKVLGASVASIVTLLLTNFLRLILIAIMIASPIAAYAMSQWLQDFAYRVDLSWWIFALAGVLAISIAVLTVGYQTIKVALVNPVKSLRCE